MLKVCSHLFVDRHCYFTLEEYQHYEYAKTRESTPNERGRRYKNHIMDAVAYWAWHTRYRFEDPSDKTRDRSYLASTPPQTLVVPLHRQTDPTTDGPPAQPSGFLAHMRAQLKPQGGDVSLLKEAQ